MARKGWVKLWHKLADDPLWLEEPFTKGQAWVDLLLLASTPDSERPGAVNCSLRYLARRWRWSRDKVSLFLKRLEENEMIYRPENQPGIRPQNRPQNRPLLTIVKYRRYQIDRTQNQPENETENEPKNRHKEEDKEAARRAGAVGTGDRKLPDVIRDAGFESWDEYNEWRRRNT